jgi:UTP-glucose-1-phosphate uridylyltransferase
MQKVRKAVIPVAGYGTRFLPFTKAVPKPMLPILNKPALQVIAEEVVNSGITDILFIVGYKKEILESHFQKAEELENMLNEKGIMCQAKAFAAGVRIEHSQEFINKTQYGNEYANKHLPVADYRLTYNGKERSCYSFCMCPGGVVVNAS